MKLISYLAIDFIKDRYPVPVLHAVTIMNDPLSLSSSAALVAVR